MLHYSLRAHNICTRMFQNLALQGGMMEEWHQKLHNNTSPDDVVICQVNL